MISFREVKFKRPLLAKEKYNVLRKIHSLSPCFKTVNTYTNVTLLSFSQGDVSGGGATLDVVI